MTTCGKYYGYLKKGMHDDDMIWSTSRTACCMSCLKGKEGIPLENLGHPKANHAEHGNAPDPQLV